MKKFTTKEKNYYTPIKSQKSLLTDTVIIGFKTLLEQSTLDFVGVD